MQQFIQTIEHFDRRIFLSINHGRMGKFQMAGFKKWSGFLTQMGSLPFQITLMSILFCIPPTRRLGLRLIIAQIIVTIIVQVIKALTARIRPYNAITGIIPLKTEKDYSFPSGRARALPLHPLQPLP